jgi:uncharacterized protein
MPIRLYARIAFCLFLLTFSAGCLEKKRLPTPAPLTEPSASQLLQQAESAWQAQNYEQSARLYARLVTQPLAPRQRGQAWRRLALSALRTDQYAQAQSALMRWALHEPGVRLEWPWHEYRIQALKGLDRDAEVQPYLHNLILQPDADWALRFAAGIRLSEILRQEKAYEDLISLLARLYAAAPNTAARGELERVTAQIARDISDQDLQLILKSSPPEAEPSFPQSVFAWEFHQRQARQRPEAWPDIRGLLYQLLYQRDWADPTPLYMEMDALDEELGVPALCLGLALPLDGPLAKTGWKVARGAQAARTELTARGEDVRLELLNTESRAFPDQLAALDPECRIIGGPVQRDAWQRIQDAGPRPEHRFFTFMPAMGDIREGRDAWRFFPSPEDQVQAVTELTVTRLGIADMAVLHPEDRFGRHMMSVFAQSLEQHGARLIKSQAYPPRDHGAWGESVAELLGVPAQQRRGREESVIYPDPQFQAVFIPDGLRQAEMLIPQLFYYDEPRLLLLGPELWSQSWMNDPMDKELHYFRLAMMPGAWWPDNPALATRALVRAARDAGLEADFWMALGYDFVRLMAEIGQTKPLSSPEDINARLDKVQDFSWSMAPLTWDAQGRATQEMFLFQPASQGLRIVDPQELGQRINRIRLRFSRHPEIPGSPPPSRSTP